MSKQEFDPDRSFTTRRNVLVAGGAIVWSTLLARLFQLQVLEGDRYEGLAAENRVKLNLEPPRRGRILDRFGKPLASHRQAGRVSIVRELAGDMDAALSHIGQLIDLSPERRERILRKARGSQSFVPTIVAEELTYEDFSKMALHAAEIPGVSVEMASTRSYPRGRDFAHVMGYVARASERDLTRLTEGASDSETKAMRRLFKHPDMRTGRSGVEYFAEDWLSGEPGAKAYVTNAAGRIVDEVPDLDSPAVPGKDVYLTIDADLQRAAIERFGDESGAAVVMDIESGDILAFVSTPAFDPNDFVNGISQTNYDLLRNNDRSPLYHKAYDGLYPPGSTYKMVVATAALETGAVSPARQVHCPGHYRFGNRTWHCWKRGGHGWMDMHRAIKGSCDTYFYEIARLTGVEAIADTSRRFGFGQKWDLGMTGGRGGVVPDDAWKRSTLGEKWYEGETLNFGIGQGYLNATPLQLALMSARIAAEGKIITPRIIGQGPNVESNIPLDEPLDPEIMQRMKRGMFGVTSEGGGTAGRSGDLGLGGPRLAGKTGTAQVRRISAAERRSGILKGDKIARKLRDHALFVAYAPADDPKYACSVIVEHGEGGSKTAAPVARDILAYALKTDSRRAPIYSRSAAVAGASGKGVP